MKRLLISLAACLALGISSLFAQTLSGGTIVPETQTILPGEQPAALTSSVAPSSGSYQWQSSADGTTWTSISGATSSNSYQPPRAGNIGITKYRRVVISGGQAAYSNMATVIVKVPGELQGGTISGDQELINHSPSDRPNTILNMEEASGGIGTITYYWQSCTVKPNWSTIPEVISIAYQPGPLSTTTHFRRIAKSDSNSVFFIYAFGWSCDWKCGYGRAANRNFRGNRKRGNRRLFSPSSL